MGVAISLLECSVGTAVRGFVEGGYWGRHFRVASSAGFQCSLGDSRATESFMCLNFSICEMRTVISAFFLSYLYPYNSGLQTVVKANEISVRYNKAL